MHSLRLSRREQKCLSNSHPGLVQQPGCNPAEVRLSALTLSVLKRRRNNDPGTCCLPGKIWQRRRIGGTLQRGSPAEVGTLDRSNTYRCQRPVLHSRHRVNGRKPGRLGATSSSRLFPARIREVVCPHDPAGRSGSSGILSLGGISSLAWKSRSKHKTRQ